MQLPQLPSSPPRVRYALTVPQSVLFADISLRGSRSDVFMEVFGAAFELDYIAIDDGAMSWDYTGDTALSQSLLLTTDPVHALRRFIATMSATARAVERASWLLSSPTNRRAGNVDDILDDLHEYWDSYERHMTSLFTFWNVEEFLSDALIAALRANGHEAHIQAGLQRFLQPSETNYFTLERRRLRRLAERLGAGREGSPTALTAALDDHVRDFGFLLSPFNLGTPPSVSSLVERLDDPTAMAGPQPEQLLDSRRDLLLDLPEPVRELGLLAQELTFWKTERLDVMALGDARAAYLYRAAAETLSISTDDLFAMSRDEIRSSLLHGRPVVAADVLVERRRGFCLLLNHGEIGFFRPNQSPASTPDQSSPSGNGSPGELRGTPASPGRASGPVRVITELSEIADLQPGDVLVTAMTRPEMGVALDRASAFVTDEGGRMCHAAIIAREMKKPCVIGVGNATQHLRSGMHVSVNGDEGVVVIDTPVGG